MVVSRFFKEKFHALLFKSTGEADRPSTIVVCFYFLVIRKMYPRCQSKTTQDNVTG